MRNLKKILALVLALVMSMSLVSVAGAKYTVDTFSDSDKIAEEYKEAVAVLSGLGLLRGDARGFRPNDTITRAEVATLVYRIITGDDTENCDSAKVYADYGKFEDCEGHWAAGMINFCANMNIVQGYNPKTFGPEDPVTGYQAILMLLRAIGWDKNGESNGDDWRSISASKAQLMGWTAKVDMAGLGDPASRQMVAEILFRAINTPQMTFTLLGGYDQDDNVLSNNPAEVNLNATLGFQNFDLAYDARVQFTDWGHPYHVWYLESSTVANGWSGNESREPVVAYDYYEAEVEYVEAVADCHVYEDLGLTEDTYAYVTFVNGVPTNACDAFDGEIEKLKTREMIGAEGRKTEIFRVNDNGIERFVVVMRDEFLAVVDEITPVECDDHDAKNHVHEYASMTLLVYDNGNIPSVLTVLSEEDFVDYEVGQWLTIYAETNTPSTTARIVDADDFDDLYEIIGDADYDTGKQSAYSNKDAHKIEGEVIDDAIRYELDEAKNYTKKTFTWFFDSYGNVLGSTEVFAEKSYATIKSIWWVDSNEDGIDGYAKAKIVYMDGEEDTVCITHINDEPLESVEGKKNVSYKDRLVSSTRQFNSAYCNVALYNVVEKDGFVKLTETDKLDNATTAPGVPALNKTFNADHATKFLVYEKGEYTTFTGINSLPTFTGGNFWVVDERTPANYGEYVFIANPTRPGNDPDVKKNTTGTFFAFNLEGHELLITSELTDDNVRYWAIDGGYVDGKEGTLKILKTNSSVKDDLEANIGKLMYATFNPDGFCISLKVVENKPMATTNVGNVVWIGTAGDLMIGTGVAEDVADDATYNTLDAELLSYTNKSLRFTNSYDDDANVYFVFDKIGTSEQKVTLIYITDETCVGAPATPSTPPSDPTTPAGIALKAAEDAVEASEEAIAAAEVALGISLAAATAEDAHEANFDAIEDTLEDLGDALADLEAIDLTELTEDDAKNVSTMIVKLTKTIKAVKVALVNVAINAVEVATKMVEALDADATTAEMAAVEAKVTAATTLMGEITDDPVGDEVSYVAAIDDNDNTVTEKIAEVTEALEEAVEESDVDFTGAEDAVIAEAAEAAAKALKNAIWAAIKVHDDYESDWDLVKSEVLADNTDLDDETDGTQSVAAFIEEYYAVAGDVVSGDLTEMDTEELAQFNKDLADEDSDLYAAIEELADAFVAAHIATLPVAADVTLELTADAKTAKATFENGVLTIITTNLATDAASYINSYLKIATGSVTSTEALNLEIDSTKSTDTEKVYTQTFDGKNFGDDNELKASLQKKITVKVKAAAKIPAVADLKLATGALAKLATTVTDGKLTAATLTVLDLAAADTVNEVKALLVAGTAAVGNMTVDFKDGTGADKTKYTVTFASVNGGESAVVDVTVAAATENADKVDLVVDAINAKVAASNLVSVAAGSGASATALKTAVAAQLYDDAGVTVELVENYSPLANGSSANLKFNVTVKYGNVSETFELTLKVEIAA